MNKGLKAAMRRAGIEDLQWHDLRRTAGCRWLQRDGKSVEKCPSCSAIHRLSWTEQRYAFLGEDKAVAESFPRTKLGTQDSGVIPVLKVAQ